MAARRNRFCRQCHGDRADVGPISKNGLCEACGNANLVASIEDQQRRHGEHYDRWLDGLARCAETGRRRSAAS